MTYSVLLILLGASLMLNAVQLFLSRHEIRKIEPEKEVEGEGDPFYHRDRIT